jgi:hypothetical protein
MQGDPAGVAPAAAEGGILNSSLEAAARLQRVRGVAASDEMPGARVLAR